jgi:uncharacterized membrane protein YdjX (TVP38/TMEM64 family)
MSSNAPARPRLSARTAIKVGLVLLLIALLVLARTVSVERPLAWLTQEVQSLGLWGPLAFAGLFVVLTVFLLPATPVVLASGAVFGPLLSTIIISAASTVSAAISFLTSRYLMHDRVARRVHHYPKLDALWHALREREGWKVVAAVRLSHALPYGVQNLLFGLSPVRFWPFVLATWFAMLPGTLLYSYLGHVGANALGSEEAGPGGWAVRLGVLAVMALAVLYVARLVRRIIREKTAVDLSKGALAPEEKVGPEEALTRPR